MLVFSVADDPIIRVEEEAPREAAEVAEEAIVAVPCVTIAAVGGLRAEGEASP